MIDTIRAIRERRPILCNDCANAAGGFDAGHRVCDDGKAAPCSKCGQMTRPIRNCRFDDMTTKEN